MLVLSRKREESIVIGDNIVIEVVKVSGNQVRLGIRAPQNVRIRRGELPPLPEVDTDPEGDSAHEGPVNRLHIAMAKVG